MEIPKQLLMLFPGILGVLCSRAALATCFPSFPFISFPKTGVSNDGIDGIVYGEYTVDQVNRDDFKNGCLSRFMVLIDLVNLRRHTLEWARAVFQGVSIGFTYQR
jgi:hypothetical protein